MLLWRGLCGAVLGVGVGQGGLGSHVCCQHSSSSPTLGGQRDLFKASSGVRDGLLQLLLAASSLCWTSPEDKLRHRDASVCLHLGSGSPSLLHVDSHSRTTAVSPRPQCLGKGSSKGCLLGNLGALH